MAEKITITELEPEELKAKKLSVVVSANTENATSIVSPTAKKVAGITAAGMLVGTAMIMATDPASQNPPPEPTQVTAEYTPSSPINDEYIPPIALTDEERDAGEVTVTEVPAEKTPEVKVTPPEVKAKETIFQKAKKLFKKKPKTKVAEKQEPKITPKAKEPKYNSWTVSKKDSTTYYKKPIPWEKLQSIRYGWDGGHIHPEGTDADFGRKKNLDS